MIQLREWQQDAKGAVQNAWAEGVRCPTVVAPTGSGKTALAAALIDEWDGPVLFTAHRDVLIGQTVRAMQRFLPGRSIGVVRGDDNELDKRITVASLQTLQRGHRLDRYIEANPPTLVIADEAHISVAEGYKNIFTRLGLADRETTALGLSATLARTNSGESLSDLWDTPVYSMSLLAAIEQGILVPPRGIQIKVGTKSLMDAAKEAALWAQDGASSVIQTDAITKIADAVAEHCQGRAAIGFAMNVVSARIMARACEQRGLTTAVITNHTPADIRQSVFDDSEAGRIDIIWSVDTLSVGADLPWISAIVMARYTKSRIWYVQAVGRGLRSHPGKTDCLVLEATENSTRIQLDTFFDLVGSVAGESDFPEREGENQGNAGEQPEIDLDDLVDVGEVRYLNFDFFARESLWLTTLGGTRFLPSYQRTIFLVQDGEGQDGLPTYSVGSTPGNLWYRGRATRHHRGVRLTQAIGMAEALATQFDSGGPRQYGQTTAISRRGASWRNRADAPSDAQINMLSHISRRLVEETCAHIGANRERMSRAEVSAVISIAVASAIASNLGFDMPLFSNSEV